MLNKIKRIKFYPHKKVSLTFKITLWYTTFIVLLIGSLVAGAFFVGDNAIEKNSKKKLIEEVTEIANGSDSFTAYEDGITLSVYDKDGNLIAGTVPKKFKVNDFSIGVTTEYKDTSNNRYIYYDLESSSNKLGNGKYVRGVVQVSKNITGWILPLIIILGSLIVIVIIMYGGYLIIKNSLKPVRDMTETAATIATSNDLSKRINIDKGSDEIHKLGSVFNEMLDSLEKFSKRERQFSSDVFHELRTLKDYEILFNNKNIKLTQDIEDNIKVFGNEILIMRMIDNLLSNALKYAKSEVNIVLAKKNSIILEIADDGIGISDEEKVNIWNRFYKVDKSRTTTEDNSSGLGLSITKKIIDLHNWKIGVLDNNPNGAKFVVNL